MADAKLENDSDESGKGRRERERQTRGGELGSARRSKMSDVATRRNAKSTKKEEISRQKSVATCLLSPQFVLRSRQNRQSRPYDREIAFGKPNKQLVRVKSHQPLGYSNGFFHILQVS